jgi:hypothetical protein
MLRVILIAAGTLVVISVEKIPLVMDDTMKVRVGEGIIFALPFLIAALWLEARARAKARAAATAAAAATPAPRPVPFGQYRGRM